MNIENIHKVADAIERGRPDVGFNMDYLCSEEPCGTVACIAGWANLLSGKPNWKELNMVHAAEFLGLDWESQANNLFYAFQDDDDGWETIPFNKITPKRAAKTLRHLAETGKVDWYA